VYLIDVLRRQGETIADALLAHLAEGHPGERFDDVYAEFPEEWCVPPIHRSRRELGRRI